MVAPSKPRRRSRGEEYRDWVRDNAPDAFDTLFVGGIEMRFDTQEARDAHTAVIATYLDAIGG